MPFRLIFFAIFGVQSLHNYHDPLQRERNELIRAIRGTLWLGLGFIVITGLVLSYFFPGKWLFFNSEIFVDLALLATFRAVLPWLMVTSLSAIAAVSTILMVISTPIAVLTYFIGRLYFDLDLESVLPANIHDEIYTTSGVAIPISAVSTLLTFWCIGRAQPYINWSVANFAKGVMAPLIALRLMPILVAFFLWVIAPLIGQYSPEGAFWARTVGVLWIVVTTPAALWQFFDGILTGFDHLATARRTNKQNIYGEGGFADPEAAAAAMERSSHG